MSGLAALAEGLDTALNTGNTMINQSHDKEMQRRQFDFNKRLNKQMSELSRQARQDSASDMVEGLRRAGLSTALAAGTNFGAVSSGGSVSAPASTAEPHSTPLGNLRLGEKQLELEALKYQDSQRELMAAQANNLNAEAESTRIDNDNKKGENQASNILLNQELDFILRTSNPNSVDYQWASALKQHPINVGTLRGISDTLSVKDDVNVYKANMWLDKIHEKVWQGQYYDNELTSAMQNLPRLELEKLTHENEKLIQEMIVLQIQAENEAENGENIKAQRRVIQNQARFIERQIRDSGNKDLIGMLEDGRYWQAIALEADHIAPSLIGGATTLGGAKMLGKTKSTPKPVPPSYRTEKRSYNKSGQMYHKTIERREPIEY